MDTLALYNHLEADVNIFNIMMSACIRHSRWRRCITIYKDMTQLYELLPSAQTFEIILHCCRHALDEPAVIYETLRLDHKLPQE